MLRRALIVGALALAVVPTMLLTDAGSGASAQAVESVSVAAPSAVVKKHPLPKVVYQVPTKDPVFFITIDDGWGQQQSAAKWAADRHIPVTSFVTISEVHGNWPYFKRISRYDSVQDHTMTHPPLGRSNVDRVDQICRAQRVIRRGTGVNPWMLRPPYGDGWFSRKASAQAIREAAATCGINWIVLWNVLVLKDGRVQFVQDIRFEPGDIVLLHFEGDLRANLAKITRLYAEHGLHPAKLSDYLKPPKAA